MIFVTLGTQDKGFPRLLEAIDREIEKGVIKEDVVVQAGLTKYESKNMKIFDLIDAATFDKYVDESDLVITHGGAGSILTALKKGKKVIAAARLSEYKEHTNDHQKQIVKEFSDKGYIIELEDFEKLDEALKKAKTFKPKKYKSNTKNMEKLISDYIEKENHISWYNKYRGVLLYLVFGGLTTLVNILVFAIARKLSLSLLVSNIIAWILSVLFAFVTNRKFVFESKNTNVLKEGVDFFKCRVLSLVFDVVLVYLLVDVFKFYELLSKIISNVFVIIINYFLSKMFVFKDK